MSCLCLKYFHWYHRFIDLFVSQLSLLITTLDEKYNKCWSMNKPGNLKCNTCLNNLYWFLHCKFFFFFNQLLNMASINQKLINQWITNPSNHWSINCSRVFCFNYFVIIYIRTTLQFPPLLWLINLQADILIWNYWCGYCLKCSYQSLKDLLTSPGWDGGVRSPGGGREIFSRPQEHVKVSDLLFDNIIYITMPQWLARSNSCPYPDT